MTEYDKKDKIKTMNKDEIIEKLKEIKPTLEKDYYIKEVGIFGSYVRDEQTESSDVDILIDYNRGMTLFTLVDLKDFLENIFKRKVDIAFKKSLKPRIGKMILSEVIYV